MKNTRTLLAVVLATVCLIGLGFVLLRDDYTEVSGEEQISDLQYYAGAFRDGSYDGSPVRRLSYHHGRQPYAEVSELRNGSLELKVGDYSVIIGATLSDTSREALVKAYHDGRGWINDVVWSDDYTERFEINSVRCIEKYDTLTGNVIENRIAAVCAVADPSITEFSVDMLVDMRRAGAWDGDFLFCQKSRQVAYEASAGIYIATLHTPSTNWNTNVFPALGNKEVPSGRAKIDSETKLTIYVSEEGIGLYEPDGTVVDFKPCVNYDPVNAFVYWWSCENPPAYCGDGMLYRFNSETSSLELITDKFDHCHAEMKDWFVLQDGTIIDRNGETVEE